MNKNTKTIVNASFDSDVDYNNLMYENEPISWVGKEVDDFFVWATERGVSDITISTNDYLKVEIHGKIRAVSKRKLTRNDLEIITSRLYNSDAAIGLINGGSDIDSSYQINKERGVRYRYRLNFTPVTSFGTIGISITARTIDSKPVELSRLGLEKPIMDNLISNQGMILVTGATGSGKTTLLSAIIRYILELEDANKKILTYESPIEFVYDEIESKSCIINQTEIGRNLPSFTRGIVNSLRRKPSIILIGESRDQETTEQAIIAANTGHLLYTTVHSNGFAETIRRMVNQFPSGMRNQMMFDIITALNMVVSQRLIPTVDGKRVAIREYVILTKEIKDILLNADVDRIAKTCYEVLLKYGRSFKQDIEDKYKQGIISEEVYRNNVLLDQARTKDVLSGKIFEDEEKQKAKSKMV